VTADVSNPLHGKQGIRCLLMALTERLDPGVGLQWFALTDFARRRPPHRIDVFACGNGRCDLS
jgi:hypothetical protein